jgi:hypothetical protein
VDQAFNGAHLERLLFQETPPPKLPNIESLNVTTTFIDFLNPPGLRYPFPMNELETTPGQSRLSRWFLSSFAFVVIYLLSTGPACWLGMKAPATDPMLRAVYYPVRVLCDALPPATSALFWYLVTVWKVPIAI